jgi:hypothetical protein
MSCLNSEHRYTDQWGAFVNVEKRDIGNQCVLLQDTERVPLYFMKVVKLYWTSNGKKMAVFWVAAPRSLVGIYRRFRDS